MLEPRLLLFDEPLSNLDFKLRIQMRDELRELQRRLGKTSIYVTHDQTEALALSDRIAVLSHGRIEQIGTPSEIYEAPATAFVAEFIGSSNLMEAIVEAQDRRAGTACEPSSDCAHGPPIRARRSERAVRILAAPGAHPVGRGERRRRDRANRFAARVDDVTYLGEDVHLARGLASGGELLLGR